MSDESHPPLDPALLAAFRQEGALIVAHERGLTATCHVKLAGVARRLGIADDRIEQAIRSLAAAEPAAPPNAQAERFRRRLRKDLSGKTRTIIGPTIAGQILAAARRKYGLDEQLAGQVLAEVTAELGLTRITVCDAIQSLTAQIDQAARDSTWLARETWDRLRSAGAKWGLELEVIDELIDERLAANRADDLRGSFWTGTTLYLAVGAVIAACILLVLLVFGRWSRDEIASPVEPMAAAPRQRASMPTWWDVDLSVEFAHARTQLNALDGVADQLASADSEARGGEYEKLIDQVRAGPERQEILPAALRMVAGCYALEPDEAAAGRLRTALLGLFPVAGGALPGGRTRWAAAFWAADTCAAALQRRGATTARKAALADALATALNEPIDAAAPRARLEQRLRQVTALAAYRQLTAAASKQPTQVASLYPQLSQRAAALLSDDEFLRAETTLLVAAVPFAGAQWKVYQRPLGRCISAPDPLPALQLTDALRRATDKDLVEYLGQLLLVRAGAHPKSKQKTDVIAAVRQALSGGARLTVSDRWLSLQQEASVLLEKPPTTEPPEVIDEYVQLTHLTTLAIALAQGDAGLATFDAGSSHPPQITVRSASDATGALLDEAQQLVAESLRQRAMLLKLSAPAGSRGGVVESLEACVAALVDHRDHATDQIAHRQRAQRYLAEDNLRYVAGLQGILIDQSARHVSMRHSPRAATARQLASDTHASAEAARSILVQLREQEAGLLKIWLLSAPET